MRGLTKREVLTGFLAAGLAGCWTMQSPLSRASGPPLWRADAGSGTAYLFGQLPLPAGAMWLTPKIEEAFAQSTELWVENPEPSREEVAALLRERAAAPKILLSEVLPSQELARLRLAWTTGGRDPALLDSMAADDAYQAFSAFVDERSQADFANLPERIFRARAKSSSLPIHTEWANLREVATFVPPAPDPLQLQLIRMGIDEIVNVSGRSEMVEAWLTGNLQPLEARARRISTSYPELYAKMSGYRNGRLADRLMQRLKDGHRPFVCVGITHLVGPKNLLSLLATRGAATSLA